MLLLLELKEGLELHVLLYLGYAHARLQESLGLLLLLLLLLEHEMLLKLLLVGKSTELWILCETLLHL